MRQKLAWSQAALEGLTLEKFDLVSKNAIRIRNMTQSNQWFVFKQPDYMAHTTNFYKSVDALYMAAVDKKLDAATEAYMNVARNCVECHRLVRMEQRENPGQAPAVKPETRSGTP
jgi:cytochrome c556